VPPGDSVRTERMHGTAFLPRIFASKGENLPSGLEIFRHETTGLSGSSLISSVRGAGASPPIYAKLIDEFGIIVWCLSRPADGPEPKLASKF
jgi:hypothetical protein